MRGTSPTIIHRHHPMPLFTATGMEPPPPPRTRYQGSKYKLLNWLWDFMCNLEFDTALDAFGGSACVSHMLKARGKSVTFNDILTSNYIVAQALIANDNERLEDDEVEWIIHKHDHLTYSNFIEKTFHNIYFTDSENAWLDVVAQNIPMLPNPKCRAIAYYALFQAAISKRPYNLFHRKNLYMRMSDVPRSFGNKATWDKSFEEHFRAFIREANSAVFKGMQPCAAVNLDAIQVPGEFDLVYIDTPYINKNGIGVDYHGFYHFLEGLVHYSEWHNRIDYQSKHRRLLPVTSPWTDPKSIYSAFTSLFSRFASSILVVSYRSDGIPRTDELVNNMRKCKNNVNLYSLNSNYKYVLSKNRKSTEVLLVGTD